MTRFPAGRGTEVPWPSSVRRARGRNGELARWSAIRTAPHRTAPDRAMTGSASSAPSGPVHTSAGQRRIYTTSATRQVKWRAVEEGGRAFVGGSSAPGSVCVRRDIHICPPIDNTSMPTTTAMRVFCIPAPRPSHAHAHAHAYAHALAARTPALSLCGERSVVMGGGALLARPTDTALAGTAGRRPCVCDAYAHEGSRGVCARVGVHGWRWRGERSMIASRHIYALDARACTTVGRCITTSTAHAHPPLLSWLPRARSKAKQPKARS